MSTAETDDTLAQELADGAALNDVVKRSGLDESVLRRAAAALGELGVRRAGRICRACLKRREREQAAIRQHNARRRGR